MDVFLGVACLLTGCGELAFAWDVRKAHGSIWRFLRAAFYIVGGIVLLVFPQLGIAALAWVMSLLFIVDGILRILMASHVSQNKAFLIIDGILGILIGVMILSAWPLDGPWVVGVLVGIRLLVAGVVLLWVGSHFRETSISA